MDNSIYCIECKKYFQSKEEFEEAHDTIFNKLNKIKHNFVDKNNCFYYVGELINKNDKIIDYMQKQEERILKLESQLNIYEEAFKNDVFFECNINLKYIKNKIDGKCLKGKCLIHFFPKCINLRIECTGDINFVEKKNFEIEILFPFLESKTKSSSIEKLQGCTSIYKVNNTSAQETIIFNNYSSSIIQKKHLISIQLLRNYYSTQSLENNYINVLINGSLTFSSFPTFRYDINSRYIIYNITLKQFISFNGYGWNFQENCFFNSGGTIDDKFIINIEIIQENEIYIKNSIYYLGKNNQPTTEKNEAKYNFKYLNKFYGIIQFIDFGDYYIICNISPSL